MSNSTKLKQFVFIFLMLSCKQKVTYSNLENLNSPLKIDSINSLKMDDPSSKINFDLLVHEKIVFEIENFNENIHISDTSNSRYLYCVTIEGKSSDSAKLIVNNKLLLNTIYSDQLGICFRYDTLNKVIHATYSNRIDTTLNYLEYNSEIKLSIVTNNKYLLNFNLNRTFKDLHLKKVNRLWKGIYSNYDTISDK